MSDESPQNPGPATENSPASTQPAAAAALQFDHVEPVDGDSNELTCHTCKQLIPDQYWHVNGQPTCGTCRTALLQHLTSPISWSTWGRVLLRGGGAALLGTLIYFAVLKITGYELGLIAIVVGLLVGSTVRKAAHFRGGWKLQAVAMALTYASIVSAYMPAVYTAIVNQAKQVKQTPDPAKQTTAPAPTTDSVSPPAPAVVSADQPAATSDKKPQPEPGLAKSVGYLFLLGCVMFFVACIAPIQAGFANFMGWIIIGIALYEAWKLNRRMPLVTTGPFPVHDGAPVAMAQVG